MIIKEKWSVRNLQMQIQNSLYERTILKGNEEKIVSQTRANLLPIPKLSESIKDPYVLNFLGLEEGEYLENELEKAIISNIEKFLLELGYGFTFAWRQKKIQVGTQFFYVNLVLYHRGLKCLVLIDLKIGSFTHADIGQMNLYLNYFMENERYEGEQNPIGIILCSSKDEEVVKYALGNLNQNIFVSKYQTLLPSQELLREKILEEKQRYFENKNTDNTDNIFSNSKHSRKYKIQECVSSHQKITVATYRKFVKLSRATAYRDLSQAEKEGWLIKYGKGRGCYYCLR